MSRRQLAGAALLMLGMVVALTGWDAALFVCAILLTLGIGLIATPRREEKRPGMLPPAVWAFPKCTPHSVAAGRVGGHTVTHWVVAFELWGPDFVRAPSIEALRQAIQEFVAPWKWQWHTDGQRPLNVTYHVQVMASNHDVAVRIVQRRADRYRLTGLVLHEISARPGTIDTNQGAASA